MVTMSPDEIGVTIYMVGGWGPHSANDTTLSPAEKKRIIEFLDTAIAVAKAESGGNPFALNSSSSAAGLFQIMQSVHKDKIATVAAKWAARISDLPEGKVPSILDARVNVDVARMVWNEAGNKWSPWEAYNTGAYKKYLGSGAGVYKTLSDPAKVKTIWSSLSERFDRMARSGAGEASTFGEAFTSPEAWGTALGEVIPNPVKDALNFVKDAGPVVGIFLLGVIMLILGIVFIVTQTKAGKAVSGVVPAGKIAKVLS